MTETREINVDKLTEKLAELVNVAADNKDPAEIQRILEDETDDITDWAETQPKVTEEEDDGNTSESSPGHTEAEYLAMPVGEYTGLYTMKRLKCDADTGEVISHNDSTHHKLSLDERIQLLVNSWRHSEYHDSIRECEIMNCIDSFKKVVQSWEAEKLYDDDRPIRRLISSLRDEITTVRETSGRTGKDMETVEQCLTQVEIEVDREETRLGNERHPEDDVTMIVEYEDQDDGEEKVVGGIIVGESDDDKHIRRNHDDLRDYTRIRHTTREKAEEFLTEHGIEVLY